MAAFSLSSFGILVYYHWEAMLVSYLSAKVEILPFRNVEQLIENKDFKVALLQGSYVEDSFRDVQNQIWKQLWSNQIHPFLKIFQNVDSQTSPKYLISDEYLTYYGNDAIMR